MSKNPKAVILRHNGGELANQLWNFASIYAYALETGRSLENHSFFEYARMFSIPVGNRLIDAVFFKTYAPSARTLWRKAYAGYAKAVLRLNRSSSVRAGYGQESTKPVYLAPSAPDALADKNTVYFDGWLFRNPIGLEKYHAQIVEYFKPKQRYLDESAELLDSARASGKRVVGVHLRQGDYETFKGGIYFVSNARAREIAEEYLAAFSLSKSSVRFVICSNGQIDLGAWAGLDVAVSKGSAVGDLFLLSRTDTVIASDSTYSAFASYIGKTPLIVMKKEAIDWEYYREPRISTANKYSTLVFY